MNILVTGGAGYIGSHAVLTMMDMGYRIVVLDNLVYGHRKIIENLPGVELIVGDIGEKEMVNRLFADYKIDVVMHFSAYAYVGESMQQPSKYYQNNVAATLNLLEAMRRAKVKYFVFSSSCATYGIPEQVPITEELPQRPINPYGQSKLMIEHILKDFDRAYGIKSVIFRYFNAAGADPAGRSGENHNPETHLIPLILQAAAKQRKSITIYGTDYPTSDGTCIRDYIHVSDLADAHVLGLQYLLSNNKSECFNLSNGLGYSVREVICMARKVTGREIQVKEAPRRAGDPPRLIGTSLKAKKVLGWEPCFAELETIVKHAWNWHIRNVTRAPCAANTKMT